MKITMLVDVAVLGVGKLVGGECYEMRPKNAQPHVDTGRAVEGHHAVTGSAATLAYQNDVDIAEIDGSGQDGRILVSDVEAVLEPAEPEDDEPEREPDELETFGSDEEEE